MYRCGYCNQVIDCRIRARAGKVSCWLPRDIPYRDLERDSRPRFSSSGSYPRPPIPLFVPSEKVIYVANIKSQIKRIGTNKKAQERNKAVKSELKTAIRATHKAVATGDKDQAATALALAGKKLDKAVSKGVIHRNQAANRKSAIAKQVSAL
ncbi:MAG: ribosomal protein [Glaciihabitans sp.]|jgi:small subunit ribosomal protein S20|nr:ribosomal protein [Glaciihabitans sp.]